MESRPSSSPLLEAASAVSQDEENPHRFLASISQEWTTQHSVLGGFLHALMLSAAKKFIVTELGDGRFPDPVHAFVQFLSMVPPGPVSITCRLLRVSARQCVVNVELVRSPNALWKKPELPATVGIFTYGDLSKERGLSQASDPALRIPVPPRETQCVTIDDPVVDSTPVTRKLQWVAPRSANGLWGHRLGGHHREVWLSFRDGSEIFDFLHLALLSDMPLQPAATHQPGFYNHYALSTLCISVEFKRRPDPSTQWVMIRSNSHMVSNGRYDVNLQILAENGDILALSNHVLYISELRPRKGAKM
jgi:acyl-coenzyme A thioesterase PaaI-like protein